MEDREGRCAVPYRTIRSGRRSIALEISREGELILRIPHALSDAQAQSFVDAHGAWIEKHMALMEARRRERPAPDEAETERLMALARSLLPGRVAHYSARMGLSPTGLGFSRAKTRLGSCSPKNRITFSCFLMAYPMEVVDYVVVHELCHIVHKNHGPGFYAAIAAVLPDYKERIRKIKKP